MLGAKSIVDLKLLIGPGLACGMLSWFWPGSRGDKPPGSDGRAFLDPMSISLQARGEKGFPLLGRP
jgi:hypothetical protein